MNNFPHGFYVNLPTEDLFCTAYLKSFTSIKKEGNLGKELILT